MAVNPVLFMLPAMLAAAEQKLLAPLRAAGATSPARAVPLAVDDGVSPERLRSLMRRGIVVEARPGLYYIDEAAVARGRQVSRPVLVVVILALSIIGFAALLALFVLD